MTEIAVTYMISDDDKERLNKITDKYKEKGLDLTPEKMFGLIMEAGSKYDIDDKLKLHEFKLGMRDDWK